MCQQIYRCLEKKDKSPNLLIVQQEDKQKLYFSTYDLLFKRISSKLSDFVNDLKVCTISAGGCVSFLLVKSNSQVWVIQYFQGWGAGYTSFKKRRICTALYMYQRPIKVAILRLQVRVIQYPQGQVRIIRAMRVICGNFISHKVQP